MNLCCGVPQGSILGPVWFTACMLPSQEMMIFPLHLFFFLIECIIRENMIRGGKRWNMHLS